MTNQSKYHVIVSERVAQMLVSHAAFLAQVSTQAAEKLTLEFAKEADSLSFMPQRCMAFRRIYSKAYVSFFAV